MTARSKGAWDVTTIDAERPESKREIIRCLKRYVAREAYRVLLSCVACSSPIWP